MIKVLGVDIGGTDIKLGIVNQKGEVLHSGTIPTRAAQGPEAMVNDVLQWREGQRGDHPEITAAGIDCAGLLDGKRRWLYSSPNLSGWENIPLGEMFESRLGLPVTLDNDANCAAWGEYNRGAGRGTKCFVCLTLGTGVGGGVVIEGRLYRGSQGLAGEVGHQVILAGGPRCGCGSRGCLEALIGADAIIKRTRDILAEGKASVLGERDDFTVRDIASAAREGDGAAVRSLGETGEFLGIGLANIVHLFNPEVIAVGGGVAGAGDFILGPARESLRKHLMGEVLSGIPVVPAQLGNRASLVGASFLALEKIKTEG
ncbi:MAG: ROK family protein [Candidatus Krumholzibacteriota bacterium]|nr:ROK family protein [Candidatus Krumholzibacteriota bacterium]